MNKIPFNHFTSRGFNQLGLIIKDIGTAKYNKIRGRDFYIACNNVEVFLMKDYEKDDWPTRWNWQGRRRR